MRIVSLLPSATEIVYALGLETELVGVTFECDEPARARQDNVVVVGGADTSAMTPGAIDAQVRARLAAGEDLYTLHRDAFAALDPDLILTQDLCRVCAVPTGQVEDALDHLGCRAEVLALDPHSLGDVLGSIWAVAERTGTTRAADALLTSLRSRLATVAAAVRGRRTPTMAVVEWVDPPFTAGHWVPDLVDAAGGDPVVANPGTHSVPSSWTAIAAAAPEVVLVAPCGFHLDGAVDQARTVAAQLPGVPVWAIDADGLVVRPGPRLVEGVEAIAHCLHPDAVAAPPAGRITRVA